MLFYGIPGLLFFGLGLVFTVLTLSTFSETRTIVTNQALLAIGSILVGLVLIMTSIILQKICNDVDDSQYNKFTSMPEYLESTLNEEKELYKYLSLRDDHSFVENIIRDNTIKFGAPNKFNDPFECR